MPHASCSLTTCEILCSMLSLTVLIACISKLAYSLFPLANISKRATAAPQTSIRSSCLPPSLTQGAIQQSLPQLVAPLLVERSPICAIPISINHTLPTLIPPAICTTILLGLTSRRQTPFFPPGISSFKGYLSLLPSSPFWILQQRFSQQGYNRPISKCKQERPQKTLLKTRFNCQWKREEAKRGFWNSGAASEYCPSGNMSKYCCQILPCLSYPNACRKQSRSGIILSTPTNASYVCMPISLLTLFTFSLCLNYLIIPKMRCSRLAGISSRICSYGVSLNCFAARMLRRNQKIFIFDVVWGDCWSMSCRAQQRRTLPNDP